MGKLPDSLVHSLGQSIAISGTYRNADASEAWTERNFESALQFILG
jgi:hypothetical protein